MNLISSLILFAINSHQYLPWWTGMVRSSWSVVESIEVAESNDAKGADPLGICLEDLLLLGWSLSWVLR